MEQWTAHTVRKKSRSSVRLRTISAGINEVSNIIVFSTITPTEMLFQSIQELNSNTNSLLLTTFSKRNNPSNDSRGHREGSDGTTYHNFLCFKVITIHWPLYVSCRSKDDARSSPIIQCICDVRILTGLDIWAKSGFTMLRVVETKTRNNFSWWKSELLNASTL